MTAYVYPVELRPDPTPGEPDNVLACVAGITGAATQGIGEAAALEAMADCLVAALGGYIAAREDIPAPPAPTRGKSATVALGPLEAAKLALYQAMRDEGLSNTALAKRLGVSEGAVRRLVDLEHRSHIGKVAAALAALGKRLEIAVREAA